MQQADSVGNAERGRGGDLHGKRLSLRPNTQRGDVADMLIRLTDTAGDPVLVNLATCRRVMPLSNGVTTVEYADVTWQRVAESIDEIERLQAQSAGPLVDLPVEPTVKDVPRTISVAPGDVAAVSDRGGHLDKCWLRIRGGTEESDACVLLSREATLDKLGLAHQ